MWCKVEKTSKRTCDDLVIPLPLFELEPYLCWRWYIPEDYVLVIPNPHPPIKFTIEDLDKINNAWDVCSEIRVSIVKITL